MCSLFSYYTIVDHSNDISVVDRGKSVRDHYTCATFTGLIDGILDNLKLCELISIRVFNMYMCVCELYFGCCKFALKMKINKNQEICCSIVFNIQDCLPFHFLYLEQMLLHREEGFWDF